MTTSELPDDGSGRAPTPDWALPPAVLPPAPVSSGHRSAGSAPHPASGGEGRAGHVALVLLVGLIGGVYPVTCLFAVLGTYLTRSWSGFGLGFSFGLAAALVLLAVACRWAARTSTRTAVLGTLGACVAAHVLLALVGWW